MLHKFGTGVSDRVYKALNWLPDAFAGKNDDNMALRCAVMALVRHALGDPEELSGSDMDTVLAILRKLPAEDQELMTEALRISGEPKFVSVGMARLNELSKKELRRILCALVAVSVRSGRLEINRAFLAEFAQDHEIEPDFLQSEIDEQQRKDIRRSKILRSGAGIAVALIVIAVFILTATLLRSVVFGLILAFIMLPCEKYFERKLEKSGSVVSGMFRFFGIVFSPLNRLSTALRRKAENDGGDLPSDVALRRVRIRRAVSLTCLLFFLLLGAAGVVLGSISLNYVSGFRDRHREEISVAAETLSSSSAAMNSARLEVKSQEADDTSRNLEKFFAPILRSVDKAREKFDQIPLARSLLAELSKVLNDESSQRELIKMLLRRTGGVFSFTAGVIGSICNILLDILLTIFFFLLFLTKIAEFCTDSGNAERQSEYLVRTIFNGNWLPGAGEETIIEAERIITAIIKKLKIWLRGYFSLVLLDSTVYTTVFYFLNVPYFFILGPLAGCGILLPFIGPVASCVLTVLVTLAAAGSAASSLQILGIVTAYLIYNGIIEQFILYPMVIGESLGLTALETIIVVLLGAIFAGISGMILAIPAASVLKYLVPQIYHCLDRSDGADKARPAASAPKY